MRFERYVMDRHNKFSSILYRSRIDRWFDIQFVAFTLKLLIEFCNFKGIVGKNQLWIDIASIQQRNFDGCSARAFDPHFQRGTVLDGVSRISQWSHCTGIFHVISKLVTSVKPDREKRAAASRARTMVASQRR